MQSNLNPIDRNKLLESIGTREINSLRKKLAARYGWETADEAVSDALVSLVYGYDPERGAKPFTLLTIYANTAAFNRNRHVANLPPMSSLDDSPAGALDDSIRLEDVVEDPKSLITLESFEKLPLSIATLAMVDKTILNLHTAQSMAETPAQRYNIRMAEKVLKVLVEILDSDVLPDGQYDDELGDMGRGKRDYLFNLVAEKIGADQKVVMNAFTELRRCVEYVAS